MGYKGKDTSGKPDAGKAMVHLWTFDTRESLDRFASSLGEHGVSYEIQNKKAEAADGPEGIVIAVAESDYAKARRILLRHRKRRTSADRF